MTKKYWKSLEDLNHTAGPIEEGEFASSPIRIGSEDDGMSDDSRRDFIKIMGASIALAAGSACTRRPVENIVPYVKQPEEVVGGVANWYASTCGACESSCGTLVKTREGRPIKLEGNPAHPASQGGLCARGQASVLSLYDPDRLQTPMAGSRKNQKTVSWEELDSKVTEMLKGVHGQIYVLTGEQVSPSTAALVGEFTKGVGATHVVYEPLSALETAMAGEASYGTHVVPRYRFENARMVVSFGADFLGTWHSPVEHMKGFSKARKADPGKSMVRFVTFETMLSLSGSNADERYTVAAGNVLKAALSIASELIVASGKTRFAADGAVTSILKRYPATQVGPAIGVPASALKKTAQELWENRGKGLILGAGHCLKADEGVALENVVNLLNSALDNEGETIDGTLSPTALTGSYANLMKMIGDMKAGRVDTLIIHDSNPVYTLPKSWGFEDGLSKVKNVIVFSNYRDETAKLADVICATNHEMESWGDASPQAGVFSIHQPTITPLYQTRGFEDSLMTWAKRLGIRGAIASQPNWYEYLRGRWKDTVHRDYGVTASFDLFWGSTLRKGVFDALAAKGRRTAGAVGARKFNTASLRELDKLAEKPEGMVAVLYPKVSLYDGRAANSSWLQELPDPISKITWDNYAALSQDEAKKLGVKEEELVKVEANGQSIELPVHVQPGMANGAVGIAVGYGRDAAGRVGDGVGANAFALGLITPLVVTVSKTGRKGSLACVQKHSSMEGRAIVKETTYPEYQKDPSAGNEVEEAEEGEPTTIWSKHEYKGYRWAMAIDLSSCTGCGACVIGCQSENNIPTVGKENVIASREMHWIRIDRYYSGEANAPETVHQPMLCQHCENAPCETVCPVIATLHNAEGLNEQVYNRCVGTRYCANNCPYKVRRFNWFTFSKVDAPKQMAYNPDVTVRTRGVMEKCTFCVQRINETKDRAKDLGRDVQDGEMKTACQQSCPADAIVFGNINDKNSRIAKIAESPRGYHVLEDLNVRPSITYLTKIRNKV